jgi:hypothetical protein
MIDGDDSSLGRVFYGGNYVVEIVDLNPLKL